MKNINNNKHIIDYLEHIITQLKSGNINIQLYKILCYIFIKFNNNKKNILITDFINQKDFSMDIFNYTLGFYVNMCLQK